MNWDSIEANWKQFKIKIKTQWCRSADDHVDVASDVRDARADAIQVAACKQEGTLDADIAPRRRVLRDALAVGCGLLVPVAFSGCDANKGASSSSSAPSGSSKSNADSLASAPTAKVTQASVQYQTEPKGEQKCSGCLNFVADTNTCKLVDGQISPEGWCVLWSKLV